MKIHTNILISDSTGETLDRIFMALKAQFNNFNYELNQFSLQEQKVKYQQFLKCKRQDSL